MAEVKFLNADGTPITIRTSGGSSRNELMERRYSVTLPSDGKVALYLYNQVSSVSVPFELKNIPLAMEVAKKTRKVLITSEVVPDPVVTEPAVESAQPKAAEF